MPVETLAALIAQAQNRLGWGGRSQIRLVVAQLVVAQFGGVCRLGGVVSRAQTQVRVEYMRPQTRLNQYFARELLALCPLVPEYFLPQRAQQEHFAPVTTATHAEIAARFIVCIAIWTNHQYLLIRGYNLVFVI